MSFLYLELCVSNSPHYPHVPHFYYTNSQCNTRFRSLFFNSESVKEIKSKTLELINITIKQKSVKNLEIQNMVCRTALFYNQFFYQLLANWYFLTQPGLINYRTRKMRKILKVQSIKFHANFMLRILKLC